jgi:hypothetical protein
MNRCRLLVVITLMSLGLGLAAPVSAIPIASFTATISASDPTQAGRLSRNGIPQDWSGGELFPGWINPTLTYQYHDYVLPGAMFDFGPGQWAGYVQISIDSTSANTFGAAYLNSYDPVDAQTTWLGDAGSSGNYFGVDPIFFQVILPAGNDLHVVFNTTAATGVGFPMGILVEGFVDSMYTDPTPVPEPASMLLLGSGLIGAVRAVRKRRS